MRVIVLIQGECIIQDECVLCVSVCCVWVVVAEYARRSLSVFCIQDSGNCWELVAGLGRDTVRLWLSAYYPSP